LFFPFSGKRRILFPLDLPQRRPGQILRPQHGVVRYTNGVHFGVGQHGWDSLAFLRAQGFTLLFKSICSASRFRNSKALNA